MKHSLIILSILLLQGCIKKHTLPKVVQSSKYESVNQCVLQTMKERELTGNEMFEMVKEECESDWNFVLEDGVGRKYYYDKDRVRKSGNILYFWELNDYIKPSERGVLSVTKYVQLDCSIFRFKLLKFQWYKKSMGEGKMTGLTPPDEWKYPPPNSTGGFMYKKICEENQQNGQGIITYPNGEKYVGELKDGKFHGKGTITYPDGSIYVGEFKDDKKNGQGTFTFPDGYKIVGEFKDGVPNGQGTLTLPSGTKYVGELKNGKPWNGTFTDKDGNTGKKVNGEWIKK